MTIDDQDMRRWLEQGYADPATAEGQAGGGAFQVTTTPGATTISAPTDGATLDPSPEPGDQEIPPGEEADGGQPGQPADGSGVDPFQRTPFQVPTMPPPPPPPPPPPNFRAIAEQAPVYQTPEGAFRGEEMWDPMRDYVLDWMENPNRYLSDLAQATRSEMDARLRHQEEMGTKGIEEWAASRGLTGSTYEGAEMKRLQEAQQRTLLEEERALLEQVATAETMDRQAALNAALGVGDFGRGLGADRREDAMNHARTGLQRQALILEAAVAGDRAAMDRARHELAVMEAMDRATLSRSELELRSEEINLRAYEIENRLNLQDRDLAVAWARHELDRERFEEAVRQYEEEMEMRTEPGTPDEMRYAFEYEDWRPDGWEGWGEEQRWNWLRRVAGFGRNFAEANLN